jgi:uncharacterized protein with PQ loop repeat
MTITPADVALLVFTTCNTARVLAYLPQIVKISRDTQGATAISYTTWMLFGVSHLSTVAYAVLAVNDWRMAAVFAANTLCCGLIVGLTAWKRAAFRKERSNIVIAPEICESAAKIGASQASLASSARPLGGLDRSEAPAAKAITVME